MRINKCIGNYQLLKEVKSRKISFKALGEILKEAIFQIQSKGERYNPVSITKQFVWVALTSNVYTAIFLGFLYLTILYNIRNTTLPQNNLKRQPIFTSLLILQLFEVTTFTETHSIFRNGTLKVAVVGKLGTSGGT